VHRAGSDAVRIGYLDHLSEDLPLLNCNSKSIESK